MGLKKPPLIEVWIQFRFEPGVGTTWSRENYFLFLNSLPDFPLIEEMVQRGIKLKQGKRSGKPVIQDIRQETLAVRASTENELRTIQLRPDELIVSYVPGKDEAYPGFASLLDEAIGHCRRYIECYHSAGVISVSLHYIDLVDIPTSENSLLAGEEYFTLNFESPEEIFGPFSNFSIKATMHPPHSQNSVQMIFATEPGGKEDACRRFRLEWHTGTPRMNKMTEEEVRANLSTAHNCLKRCFQHAFTEKGWALFEPETI